jgi:hypothetical protein
VPYLVEILLKTWTYCHVSAYLDVCHHSILYFESVKHSSGSGTVENKSFLGYRVDENKNLLGYGAVENKSFLGCGVVEIQSVWGEILRYFVQAI